MGHQIFRTFLCILLVCCSLTGFSQTKSNADLFVHFDKNIYANNETIWFTAYLLNYNDTDTTKSIFSVVLIRSSDGQVIREEKFSLFQGLAFGSLDLPNVLSTGEYKLIAYTNQFLDNRPVTSFVQPISIYTTTTQPLNLRLTPVQQQDPGSDEHFILTVTGKDNSFLPKPSTVQYTYANKTIVAKTGRTGQVNIVAPIDNNAKDPRLIVHAKNGTDSGTVMTLVRPGTLRPVVKFFPEGGAMTVGLPGNVGLEVKDQFGTGLSLRAQILKNGNVISTAETNSNGLGKFSLLPESNANYTLKLIYAAAVDTTFSLPEARKNGEITLQVNTALATDTLKTILRSPKMQKVIVRLHNFETVYAEQTISFINEVKVLFPLKDLPKGLATITVSDASGNPLAERMCFLHYEKKPPLIITTDSTEYQRRKKVVMTLKFTDKTTSGLASVAVVQDSRINAMKQRDITDFAYLEKELESLPVPAFGNKMADKEYLENILLVKGWSNYKPTKQLEAQTKTLKVYGQIYQKNSIFRDTATVGIMKDKAVTFVKTANDGVFTPTVEHLETAYNKGVQLFSDSEKSFSIEVTDEFKIFNKKIGALFPDKEFSTTHFALANTGYMVGDREKSIAIKEVEIKLGRVGAVGPNACGDYVCPYKILNCKNHHAFYPGTTQPENGKKYLERLGGSEISTEIIYTLCKNTNRHFIKPFPTVNTIREFYSGAYTDTIEPAFFSTIYWNHSVIIPPGEAVKLTFYTGDISGKFRVVVQGLTQNDVFSGKHTFEVKP